VEPTQNCYTYPVNLRGKKMPVTFKDKNNKTNYLIPAPMVSINREYDRTGDGAIIGVRYPITLTGTLVAGMGVPDYAGSFIDSETDEPYNENVDNTDHVSKEKWMYRAIQNKQMALRKLFAHHNEGGELHIQALDSEGFKCNPRILGIDFSQEPAQPNIMVYTISMEVDEIQGPPGASGTPDGDALYAGKTAEGLDVDPEGRGANDLDGVNSPFFKYAVKSANENWSMDEQEGKTIYYKNITDSLDPDHKRYRHVTEKDGTTLSGFKELSITAYDAKVVLADAGDAGVQNEIKKYKPIGGYRLQKALKTYTLTHTMSATGKRVFDTKGENDTDSGQPATKSGDNPPNLLDDMSDDQVDPTRRTDALEGCGTPDTAADADNLKEKDFVPDGEAWQQARGYILNYISGTDPKHRGPGYQKALTNLEENTDPNLEYPDNSGSLGSDNPFLGDSAFVDLYGINLPRIGTAEEAGIYGMTATAKNQHKYTACDYKRVQSIDKTAGTFSITESWVLVDRNRLDIEKHYESEESFDIGLTTETIEFSIEDNKDSGFKEGSIAGTITGVVETQDEHLPDKEAEVDSAWNQDKFGKVEGIAFKGQTPSTIHQSHGHKKKSVEETEEGDAPSLKCRTKYEEALRRFHWLEPKLHEILQTSTGEQFNPARRSFSITKNPVEGTISYSASFDTRNNNTIPCSKFESVIVNDTHPSHVFAETAVLGRRMGPVLQDINTQTSWKRNLSVEVGVSGVIHGKDWNEAMRSKPSMLINKCFHPDFNTGSLEDAAVACQAAGFTWVDPVVQQCGQGNAIREIIDSISPRGKFGITNYFVSAGPQESWDAINGQYTFSIEWTYELEEGPFDTGLNADGLKKAISKSYLGTAMFQYPRVIERKESVAHETQEQILHDGPAEHHPGF